MEVANLLVVAAIGAVVLVPLAREYADFRASWGLGRLAALATTLLVLPALSLAIVLTLPLASSPALQWTATVIVTLGLYSLGTAAISAAREPARAPRRSA